MNKESLNKNLCISCNNEEGYYPIDNEINNVNNFIKCYKSPEGYYFDNVELLYKKCYISCKTCDIGGSDSYHNCVECNDNYIYQIQFSDYKNCYDNYNNCPYYYFDTAEDKYYCTYNSACEGIYNKLIIETKECIDECDKRSKYKYRNQCYPECPENTIKSLNKNFDCEIICNESQPFELINEQICIEDCSLNLIKQKLCIFKYQKIQIEDNPENNNGENKKNEEIKVINILLDSYEKGFTSEDYNTSEIDKGQDDVYEEKELKVIFSNFDNQKKKENEKNNYTSINFGDCEIKLREYYKISEDKLLYTKIIEIPSNDMKIPKIEYENFYCKLNNSNLVQLDKSICKDSKIDIILPVRLDEDINKLNSSSDYYNDICYTTSSESGTDITLEDRKKEFIDNNKTVCQENCVFSKYNYETQKAYCSCEVKQSSKSFADMHIDKSLLYKNFVDIKNIANIKILNCYNILFKRKYIKKNIGFFISIIIILFHIIGIFILYKIDWNILNIKIDDIIVSKQNLKLYMNEKKLKLKRQKYKNRRINNKKHKSILMIKENKNNYKNVKHKNNLIIPTKEIKNNNNYYKNYIPTYNSHRNPDNIKENQTNIDKQNSFNNLKSPNLMQIQKIIRVSKKIMKFDDEELNNLSYKLALIYDKRTYTQYYMSLLRTKHIIFFSFFNNNDYNSKIIKIDLFFIGFILDCTVNALFFNDETMHKIYEDKGTFNFVYQLPQIIYSYLISYILNILLNLLAISEDDIINFKQIKTNIRGKDLKRKSFIKFISFISLGFILLFCFGYYLSMFCTIYTNTQIHLIKDTLISFGISLVSPIIIYIFPGLFRIPSLSNPNKKSKYLFIISKIIQML